MQIGNVTQSQVDNLNYACTMVGSFQPHITGLPRSGHGIIIFYSYTDQGKQNGAQEVIYTDGDRYWRKAVNDAVTPWFRVATATPPEEIPLNLAEGFIAYPGYACLCYKTQFGEIGIQLIAQYVGTEPIGIKLLATLPEGFRLAYHSVFPVVVNFNGQQSLALIAVDTDGVIYIHSYSSATGNKAVTSGYMRFVAAP